MRQIVAVLAAVLEARRLVLAVVVLDHLGEAHGGEALLVEGSVVRSASDPVPPQHHQQVEVLHVALAEPLEVARPLARRAVVLAAHRVS